MLGRIPAHPGVAHLGVGQPDGVGIGQHGGVDLVLGAHDDIHAMERGTHRGAEGAGIVPLVRPEVQVEDDGCAGLSGELRRIKGGAPARLLAQVGAGELEHAALRDRRRQHIIDRQRDIGAVVPVEDQRELVGRLDAQDDGAGVPARFSGAEADIHPFFGQKMGDEIADRVLAESGQQRRLQSQPAAPDAHVGGGAAHVGGKALDIDKVGPDIVAVEVHAGTAHMKRVVGG